MSYHYILKGWVKVCILYVTNIKNHKIMSTAENTTTSKTMNETIIFQLIWVKTELIFYSLSLEKLKVLVTNLTTTATAKA